MSVEDYNTFLRLAKSGTTVKADLEVKTKFHTKDLQGYNVLANGFDFHGIKKVNLDFHKRNSKSCLKEGDILTVQTGDVGLTTYVPKHLEGSNCHALIITRFNPSKVYYLFMAHYFNSNLGRSRMKELETGTTMKHLNVGDMLNWRVPLPPTLTEQKAIATVLSDVDEMIAKLEKLIEKKKAIKQGAMQQLLTPPHKGGKRLQGFSGEWVEYQFSEILTFGSGMDYKHLEKGDIPVYGTGGIMTHVKGFLYDGESVGIGRKGTIDQPVFLKGKFWTVDTLFYTHSFQNCIPLFIYYLFLMIPWKEYNEASGVPSLNKNTLGKIKVVIPKAIEEQHAIAQVLSTIEDDIKQLEKRRNKIAKIKQGMMQELLTGRTRL
jgi:type I restriction enzyme S subunit